MQKRGRALVVLGMDPQGRFLLDVRVLRVQMYGLDRQAGGCACARPAQEEQGGHGLITQQRDIIPVDLQPDYFQHLLNRYVIRSIPVRDFRRG